MLCQLQKIIVSLVLITAFAADAYDADRYPVNSAVDTQQISKDRFETLQQLNKKIYSVELMVANAKEVEANFKDIADDAFQTAAISRSLMIVSTALLAGAVGTTTGGTAAARAFIQKEFKSNLQGLLTVSTIVSVANLSIIAAISESVTGLRRALVGKTVKEIVAENEAKLGAKITANGNYRKAHADIRVMIDQVDLEHSRWLNGLMLGTKDLRAVTMMYTLYVADRVLWEKELEDLKAMKSMGQQIGWLPQ